MKQILFLTEPYDEQNEPVDLQEEEHSSYLLDLFSVLMKYIDIILTTKQLVIIFQVSGTARER